MIIKDVKAKCRIIRTTKGKWLFVISGITIAVTLLVSTGIVLLKGPSASDIWYILMLASFFGILIWPFSGYRAYQISIVEESDGRMLLTLKKGEQQERLWLLPDKCYFNGEKHYMNISTKEAITDDGTKILIYIKIKQNIT